MTIVNILLFQREYKTLRQNLTLSSQKSIHALKGLLST